jgi:hypothetical protein
LILLSRSARFEFGDGDRGGDRDGDRDRDRGGGRDGDRDGDRGRGRDRDRGGDGFCVGICCCLRMRNPLTQGVT